MNANPYQPPGGESRARRRRWVYYGLLLGWVPISVLAGFAIAIRVFMWPQIRGEVEGVSIDANSFYVFAIFVSSLLYLLGRLVVRSLFHHFIA